MNFFENKDVEIYKIVEDSDTNEYGDTIESKQVVLKCKCDIQPAGAEIVEKEFGKVENARFILWTETNSKKKIVKNLLVDFKVNDELKTYEIKELKQWDDYCEFVVADVKRNIPTVENTGDEYGD